MANIQPEITEFKSAVYGEEVRDSMVSLANKLNTEVDEYSDELRSTELRLAGQNPYKNILDEDPKFVKSGVYVMYETGVVGSNTNYKTVIVPVFGGRHVSISGMMYAHISFFSEFVDLDRIQANNQLEGYISGVYIRTEGKAENVSVPNNAVYMLLSYKTSETTAQVEYGSSSTSYIKYGVESAKEAINAALVNKIDYDIGKNLLNTETENKLVGFFAYGTTGVIATNAAYELIMLPINGGDVLSFNSGFTNAHVAFYSVYTDISNMGHGQSIPGYISGFANDAKQGYVVPANAVAMSASIKIDAEDSAQVEIGSASTSYKRYKRGISASKIIGGNSGTLIVGSSGEYTTISEAVSEALDGSTIFIMPGIYEESLHLWDRKLHIKGFSRDSVIIQYSSGNYANPPFELAKGVVEDLTIKTIGNTKDDGAVAGAYCVHIDNANARNESLQFKNVRFVSEWRPCVGIGLRENFRLSFINCEFENMYGQEVFYCHEEQESNKPGQYVELIDCSLKTSGNYRAITLQETPALENSSATIRMQRCIVKRAGTGAVIAMVQYGSQPGLDGDGYLGSKVWSLDLMSALNSDALLNA